MASDIQLTQTDLASRVRRFLNARGTISPSLVQAFRGVINFADLSKDPYQQEWNYFSATATNGGVAGQLSTTGITGLAPASLVWAISIIGVAGTTYQLSVARPNTFSAGTRSGAAPFNNGGRGAAAPFFPLDAQVNQNNVGGPGGVSTIDRILIDTARSVLYVLPSPVVLYGPPFNGQGPGSTSGDGFFITNLTVAGALSTTVFWSEYPNAQPG